MKANNTTQSDQTRILRKVSRKAGKVEKTAWLRKYTKMQNIIETLIPIDEEIYDIVLTKKQPILDEIATLRAKMVNECIHPFDQLVYTETHVECKFCNKRIVVTDE